jgi:Fur family iron response transcriptional regulator
MVPPSIDIDSIADGGTQALPANAESPLPPRPFAGLAARLRAAGLRPTRQRLGLAKLLFTGIDRHVNAEALCAEAMAIGVRVSLATVYNCLNQFTEAGLLRQVVVDGARTWFDTNVTDHHHFFHEGRTELIDIERDQIQISGLPAAPPGAQISRVEIIIRLSDAPAK